jgi:hypothetical protein
MWFSKKKDNPEVEMYDWDDFESNNDTYFNYLENKQVDKHRESYSIASNEFSKRFQYFKGFGWIETTEYSKIERKVRFDTLREFLANKIKEDSSIFEEVLSVSFFCPKCFKHITLNKDFYFPCSVCETPNNFYDLVYGCNKCNIILPVLNCPHCGDDIELNYLYYEQYIRQQLQK